MATGTVRWFDQARGYGFIAPAEGDKDVFVHRSAVIGDVLDTLREGANVEFDVVEGPKGPQAANVKLAS